MTSVNKEAKALFHDLMDENPNAIVPGQRMDVTELPVIICNAILRMTKRTDLRGRTKQDIVATAISYIFPSDDVEEMLPALIDVLYAMQKALIVADRMHKQHKCKCCPDMCIIT